MKKKILVVGEYYSENLGDGVICDNVNYILSSAFPNSEVKIADIMGRTDFIDSSEYTNSVFISNRPTREKLKNYLVNKQGKGLGYIYERLVYRKWEKEREEGLANIRDVLQEKFDLVVFAGGQLLYEPFVIPIEEHIKILSKNNTPMIFNGCGIGAFNNKYILSRFNKALNNPNIKSITVRDYVDEVNEKILVNNSIKAKKTSDPALWTKETYGIPEAQSRKKIGLGIIHRNNPDFMEKQKELYKELIFLLETLGQEWELFCNGELVDQEFAYMLMQELNLPKSNVAVRSTRPSELVELIASYDSIISFRLHSHIIATSLRVPSIGMTWDKKVKFFFESFNNGSRCFSVDSKAEDIIKKLGEINAQPLDGDILLDSKIELENILISEVSKYI